VNVHSEARYGAYGYDHLVEVENTCDKTLVCRVKTNLNPEPTIRYGSREGKAPRGYLPRLTGA